MKISKPLLLILIVSSIFLVSACSSNNSVTPIASPDTSTASVDPSSNIGKADQNGVTVTVDVPKAPACLRTFVSVKMDTFEQCLPDGLTYVQVANVLGYRGTLQTQSGSTEIWQWNGREGSLSIVFDNGKLKSKAQAGLQPGDS
jgi:hypothetical protein